MKECAADEPHQIWEIQIFIQYEKMTFSLMDVWLKS